MRKTAPTFNPKLSIIQVGAREDSSVYVNMKKKAAKEVKKKSWRQIDIFFQPLLCRGSHG
jgi:5,10-methylene-tetrahydrofolate dehydrogenase/methenyl tetrahydrofolate cyclohydrolase